MVSSFELRLLVSVAGSIPVSLVTQLDPWDTWRSATTSETELRTFSLDKLYVSISE